MIQVRGFGSGFVAAAFCSVMLVLAGCGSSEDGGKVAAPPELGKAGGQASPGVVPKSNLPKAAPEKTIFMGEVTAADGQPLGTSVTLSLHLGVVRGLSDETNTSAVLVGDDGRYKFEMDSPPMARLSASGKGLLTMATFIGEGNGIPSEGKTVVRDFEMERGLEVSGRLLDASGTPVDGRVIATWPMDLDSWRNAKPDAVRVMPYFQARSFASEGFSLTVASRDIKLVGSSDGYGPVDKLTTAPASGVEIRLGEGASIEGMVLMHGTREGVSSVTVVVNAKDLNRRMEEVPGAKFSEVVTNPQGAFHLRGMSDGVYALMASSEKLFPFPYSKGTGNDWVPIVDGVSTSGIELMVYPGHTVTGRVTKKGTGEPIAGVDILHSYGLPKVEAQTDADGRYRLFPVTSGKLYVAKEGLRAADDNPQQRVQMFFPSGAAMASILKVDLGDALDVTRDFEMADTITISGKVMRKNGDIIPDASISFITSGDAGITHYMVKVKNDGTFKLEVLPNISGCVQAFAPGYAPGLSDMVEVKGTSMSGVDVILKAGGALGGVVVDPQGKPVPEAEVLASHIVRVGTLNSNTDVGTTISDSQGRFTLLNLPVGEVTLIAKKEGFASSANQKEAVDEGKTRSDVRLQLP